MASTESKGGRKSTTAYMDTNIIGIQLAFINNHHEGLDDFTGTDLLFAGFTGADFRGAGFEDCCFGLAIILKYPQI